MRPPTLEAVDNIAQVYLGERPNWDEYFMGFAKAADVRADCRRRQVGAVIATVDHRLVMSGYNGAPSGGPSCLRGECPRGLLTYEQLPANGSYANCVALHAEQNAILWTDRRDREGGTIYVTAAPCDQCCRLIAGSGLAYVVYPWDEETLMRVEVTPTLGGLL